MRAMIIGLHKAGKSHRKIAEELKISRRTVDYNVMKFKTSGSIIDKKRSGCPRKTTKINDRHIVILSKRNRQRTAPEIKAKLKLSRLEDVSVSTVKRRLQEAGLYGRVSVKNHYCDHKIKVNVSSGHDNITIGQLMTGKTLGGLTNPNSKFLVPRDIAS